MEEAKPEKPKQPTEQARVKCEGFPEREAAQKYLDARPTQADRAAIDPDSNGQACDEGAYLFARSAGPPTTASASASASTANSWGAVAGTTGKERAEQREAGCGWTYMQEQDMSRQEANDYTDEVVDWMSKKMQDDPSLTVGPAENAALDDMNVPRYPQCEFQ